MTMTPHEFIKSLAEGYQRARVPVKEHKKLSRGESRSIASEAEDMLAYYLIDRIKGVDHIFINQTLTSVLNGREERRKPNLVICRGDEIRMLIDLKMDLGYKRDEFRDSINGVDTLVEKLRGQEFRLQKKVDHGVVPLIKTLSKNAKYVFVVISNQNIGGEKFRRIEELASGLDNTGLFVLLRGKHLNGPEFYGRSLDDVMTAVDGYISQDDFVKLETLLNESLA